MNITLRDYKHAIRTFIREHWSDQKLHEVYAFNRDGKLDAGNPCGCILGVSLSERLHQDRCSAGHYMEAHNKLSGASFAEQAYMSLSWVGVTGELSGVSLRGRRLSAILRAEMRLRARKVMPAGVHVSGEPEPAMEEARRTR